MLNPIVAKDIYKKFQTIQRHHCKDVKQYLYWQSFFEKCLQFCAVIIPPNIKWNSPKKVCENIFLGVLTSLAKVEKTYRDDKHVKTIPEWVKVLNLHLLQFQNLLDEVVDDEDGKDELAA
jgi:hypothetical protein